MSKKQTYLSDEQISEIRSVVNDLVKKGLIGTLKSAAIDNLNSPLENQRYIKDPYMSSEQAWATAVVSHLISAGYEIKKRENGQ